MPVTVAVNFMSVSHKGSNGISMAFPDVCKTPSPGGPIPIPYPNIAMSKDTMSGSKTVKMDGQPIMTKGANMSMSTGDEAGSAGGVVSSKVKGKAEFVNYSFDVKVDGKNVCRLIDPAQQNMGGSANAFGPAHLQAPVIVIPSALENCKKEVVQLKKKQPDEKTVLTHSGIDAGHHEAIKAVAQELGVILYFRRTNHYCAERGWIRGKHKPKPHEVLNAKTISDGDDPKKGPRPDKNNVPGLRRWIQSFEAKAQVGEIPKDDPYLNEGPPLPDYRRAEELCGVVMSLDDRDFGRPLRGYGVDSNGYDYDGKWITGDYDLQDVILVGDSCERPGRAEGEDPDAAASQFARIKRTLNKRMGWDGIQHPWQEGWETDDFSFPAETKAWLATPEGTPPRKVQITPDRQLSVCDDDLTIVAPKTILAADSPDDTKKMLLCSGCGDD